ncbi:MAG: hypothetical protein JWM71_1580 [Solirubrobacteraceae bacterium]|nr:hypothetical protein [Solirubrobacteraceae bacterium]
MFDAPCEVRHSLARLAVLTVRAYTGHGRRLTERDALVPRKPIANAVTALACVVALGGGTYAVAAGKHRASRACAVASGNCSHRSFNGADFGMRSLTRTRWVGASLRNVNFRRSDLFGSHFAWSDLRGADLSTGNRTQADFRHADLRGANVSNADFWGTNLRHANLAGAIIRNTRFDKTDLVGVDFTGAKLYKTTINGARLCHTIQPDGTTRDDNCSGGGSASGIINCPTLPGAKHAKKLPGCGTRRR